MDMKAKAALQLLILLMVFMGTLHSHTHMVTAVRSPPSDFEDQTPTVVFPRTAVLDERSNRDGEAGSEAGDLPQPFPIHVHGTSLRNKKVVKHRIVSWMVHGTSLDESVKVSVGICVTADIQQQAYCPVGCSNLPTSSRITRPTRPRSTDGRGILQAA
ncbi:hypothetical protein AXG93_146s1390 [Marchantia polymorpha subsp. ruderalis]|uniref:Uncharacterized protein n=1 Tax=Marchantia polymorpha subsp. ruderalis TaxID=1480154 RepID=A0A176W8W6_MARPO|nr:hypothetical protein AXG93_146s1390 [Marchantia polymorpha subsp. ruderalis]